MTIKIKDVDVDVNEFERQVLAGEITNFEPYFDLLMSMTEPNRDVLDTFIKTADEFADIYDCEPLYQKHTAYKIIPTTIEKTMTPLQLCKADNLLWTLPYSGNQVALVNHTLRDPLNNLTAEFVFSALDYGVQNSSELVSYTLYHQKN